MAVEAEILDISRDLTTIKILVVYRDGNQEVSREVFPFQAKGLTKQIIKDEITHGGIILDSSVFSENDLKTLLGLKMQITKDDIDPTISTPFII